MTARLALAMIAVLLARTADAQPPGINQEEAKVPPYTLPDPLLLADGGRVADAATWEARRRPEILRLFETHVYGKMPGRPDRLTFQTTRVVKDALGGKATRKEITVLFAGTPDGPRMDLALYVPNAGQGPRPAVLSLNFGGNHAVDPDPGVPLARPWTHTTDPKKSFQPTDKDRGKESSRWPPEHIIDRGYAVATAYYGDIDPDFDDGFQNGVHPLVDPPGQTLCAADAWELCSTFLRRLGPEPRPGLPGDRPRYRREARHPHGPLAARQGRPLGRGAGSPVRRRRLQRVGRRRRGAEPSVVR